MGVTLETWRQRIGSFSQPLKSRTGPKILTLSRKYMSLSIRIVLFLLLTLVGGVEPNPGPRGRGNNRGRGAGGGGPGSRFQNDGDIFANSQRQRTESESLSQQTRMSTRSRSHNPQSTINAWLHSSDPGQGTKDKSNENKQDEQSVFSDRDSVISDSPNEPVESNLTTGNQMEILLDIQSHVRGLDKRFDKLEGSMNDLRRENKRLADKNDKLAKHVSDLSETVKNLELETKELKTKNEQLESQSRRENLKFFEIEESGKETWDETEEKVRNYIKNDLELDDSEIKIERAHRLPGKTKPRPVIVKFSFFKDKDRVLRKYREKSRSARSDAQETDESTAAKIRVSEDFPERIRKARNLLIPFLKEAIAGGKNAYLKFDKLVVNGYTYVYDEDKQRPVPVLT